jgi:hypothetical protein
METRNQRIEIRAFQLTFLKGEEMAYKFKLNTKCGELEIFEKSVKLRRKANNFFLQQQVDQSLANTIKNLIDVVFELGKQERSEEFSKILKEWVNGYKT